jgi:hypothetical protein
MHDENSQVAMRRLYVIWKNAPDAEWNYVVRYDFTVSGTSCSKAFASRPSYGKPSDRYVHSKVN